MYTRSRGIGVTVLVGVKVVVMVDVTVSVGVLVSVGVGSGVTVVAVGVFVSVGVSVVVLVVVAVSATVGVPVATPNKSGELAIPGFPLYVGTRNTNPIRNVIINRICSLPLHHRWNSRYFYTEYILMFSDRKWYKSDNACTTVKQIQDRVLGLCQPLFSFLSMLNPTISSSKICNIILSLILSLNDGNLSIKSLIVAFCSA
jgi:hypothetical protein